MPPRRLLPVIVLAFLGCGAPPGEPAAPSPPVPPPPAAAPGASTEPVVAITPDPADRLDSSAAQSSVPSPPAAPPPAAPSASPASASTPLTAGEKKIADMCLGKTSKFTEKEEKLLRLAEGSGRADLKEQAAMLREARENTMKQACERLRAEGKL